MSESRARVLVREFWSSIKGLAPLSDGPCLEWPGSRNPTGYGTTRRNGQALASRAVWVEVFGEIPAGKLVCHRCDNPPCVRPAHLFLGSHADNTADMMRKGRQVARTGERNGRTTIADAVVFEMREKWSGGQSFKSLAREYHVHPVTVSRICRRLRRTA